MKKNLLIVEDDEHIRDMLRLYFSADYNVVEAEDGEEALQLFRLEKIDLVFLDIMLPGMDGLRCCERLREHSDVAVIIITAKSQEEDKLRGFTYGADEYVTKPFSLKVLAARAENLLKRVDGDVSKSSGLLRFGELTIDRNNGAVLVHGEPVVLSKKEYDLLWLLVKNRDIVMSKDVLLDRVWGFDYEGDPRTLDTCVSRLRKKLSDQKTLIQTVPGRGYCFQSSAQKI